MLSQRSIERETAVRNFPAENAQMQAWWEQTCSFFSEGLVGEGSLQTPHAHLSLLSPAPCLFSSPMQTPRTKDNPLQFYDLRKSFHAFFILLSLLRTNGLSEGY